MLYPRSIKWFQYISSRICTDSNWLAQTTFSYVCIEFPPFQSQIHWLIVKFCGCTTPVVGVISIECPSAPLTIWVGQMLICALPAMNNHVVISILQWHITYFCHFFLAFCDVCYESFPVNVWPPGKSSSHGKQLGGRVWGTPLSHHGLMIVLPPLGDRNEKIIKLLQEGNTAPEVARMFNVSFCSLFFPATNQWTG